MAKNNNSKEEPIEKQLWKAADRLRVIVKRILRQYKYPPDMQKLATDTVLQQAELIADELAVEG